MKKPNPKERGRIRRKNVKDRRNGVRRNNIRKRKSHKLTESILRRDLLNLYRRDKRNLLNEIYSSVNYKTGTNEIIISEQFGLEEGSLDNFLEKSESIINTPNLNLNINIKQVTRMWPSSITMLCSLKQWVDNGENFCKTFKKPNIASTDSESEEVNGYLNESGFYNFVGRSFSRKDLISIPAKSIVKIKREMTNDNIEDREYEILELLRQNSNFSKEEIEYFNSIILSETFLNVTEHGTGAIDKGWWVLGQAHKLHEFISLNIADNGIGLRNSLMIGPQGEQIKNTIPNLSENEGEFLKLAMEQNVSGAFDAATKSGFIAKSYEQGSRRGNGLKRIKSACKSLGIEFTMLSHFGYIRYKSDGELDTFGSKKNRIFAGTMYHYLIPLKGNRNIWKR
ncbi:hypothetical protein CH352_00940 [Leptospira hartskeerlii]|uniref:Uncharacterized protein n=1 Tax=Leptospira hartskeerlii TaxID=2023177 RepID=A0A2M9X8F0_9LEPT|nr:hypothetical protein [Leptospira hartskeerlii]PJZ23970.1 hypothetical protein CH357_18520 [Leptospira hartskeerlii]PJZ35234.1 hypothetical protein CH352_00940 [Leptospira hartskeerlii]